MDHVEDAARLRARVAELEAELAATGDRGGSGRDRHSRWRTVCSAVLIVTACALAPLSVTSVWAGSVLSDADRYVDTVAPIADDPGVQAAITDAVTISIMDSLDVDGMTTEALDALAEGPNLPPRVASTLPALAVPLTRGIESFTHEQVADLIASPQFQEVWAEVNRVAHTQVVQLLEGNEGGVLSAQEDTITLNLAPVIEEAKERLVDQGFDLAEGVPEIDRSFVLVQSDGITKAQNFYVLLNRLGLWLPFIAVGLFGVGVLLAHDRRTSLLRGALGVALAMVALSVALVVVQTLYVETTPADVLTAKSAGSVFESLVRFLRDGLRAAGALALLVALAAFLSGSSSPAVRFGCWVFEHKRGLRLAAFLAGVATVLLWTNPTAGTVISIALIVILTLALIEFLARPPAAAPVGAARSSEKGEAAAPSAP